MRQRLHATRNSADGPASPIRYRMMTLGCVNRPDQSASNDHPTKAGSERESASAFFETTYVSSVSGIQSASLASVVGRPVEKIRSKLEREVGQTHIADLSKRSECSLNLRMSGSAPRCLPACIVTSFSFPVYDVVQESIHELNRKLERITSSWSTRVASRSMNMSTSSSRNFLGSSSAVHMSVGRAAPE
jgi:hypothetical protein